MENILFVFVVFLTNIIQAITGFAGTMLAMPVSTLLIGIEKSRAILNIMGLLSSLFIVIRDFLHINFKEFWKMSFFMTLGMIAGFGIMQLVQPSLLLKLYGVFIFVIALKKMFQKKEVPLAKWLGYIIILLAGIIHSMFVSGGSLLVLYAATVFSEKKTFRSTLSMVWVFLNTLLFISHIKSGYFTSPTVHLTLACILPLILAVWIGTWLHNKVRQETFLKITYILLLISGIMLLK
ncbi:MAG: sulfite exporter TauE/SafE family protein [Fusicatenibacter sp.]